MRKIFLEQIHWISCRFSNLKLDLAISVFSSYHYDIRHEIKVIFGMFRHGNHGNQLSRWISFKKSFGGNLWLKNKLKNCRHRVTRLHYTGTTRYILKWVMCPRSHLPRGCFNTLCALVPGVHDYEDQHSMWISLSKRKYSW